MTTRNHVLQDLGLSLKAGFLDLFGSQTAQRAVLLQLLELRAAHYPAGDAAIGRVKEQLAFSYLGWSASDLQTAEQYAVEAESVLTATGRLGRNSRRVADLIHLRSQVKQRLNQPVLALELGEDALSIYNRTAMISWQRARLMQSLITLHRNVGDAKRADRLAVELATLTTVLNSRPARYRY
jgi:hypothetical protein